jgi:D-3-phosphoglycerate dehydrogenase
LARLDGGLRLPGPILDLRAADVNIATFHLGRTGPGEAAIALVAVDQQLTPELVERVRRLPNVIQATAMRF